MRSLGAPFFFKIGVVATVEAHMNRQFRRWVFPKRSGVQCMVSAGACCLLLLVVCVTSLATDSDGSQSNPPDEAGSEQDEGTVDSGTSVKPRVSREEIGAAVVQSPFAFPSPVAWFRAFNKLGSPRWRKLYREPASITITDRHKAALALGVTLADAYIAVESRAGQEVRNVLLNLRSIEKTLGISERTQHRNSRLGELADAEQWSSLRVELEALMSEQAAVLREQRDGPLAELLPIGLLLRTINASCDIVRDLDLRNGRVCIGDVTLVIALIRRVETLPERTLRERSVRDVRRCLKTVRDCWGEESNLPAPEKVTLTGKATDDFLNSLFVNE